MTEQRFKKIAAGHYRHDETGIEIVRVAPHREHGYAVGVHWHVRYVAAVSRELRDYGRVRTLGAASKWVFGEHGPIEVARRQLALAWDEAHAENDEREAFQQNHL